MTDLEYLKGIRNDDNIVLEKFYQNFKPVVKGLVKKKDSYQIIDYDDFYNEVIIEVIMKIKKSELDENNLSSKLSTYIYSVANNQLNNRFRKNKNNIIINSDNWSELDIHITEDTVIHPFDLLEKFLEKLKALDNLCFKIIKDWYLNNVGYEKLAVEYGYSNYNSIKKKKGKCIEKARALALGFDSNLDS